MIIMVVWVQRLQVLNQREYRTEGLGQGNNFKKNKKTTCLVTFAIYY